MDPITLTNSSYFEKPIPHHTIQQWYSNNNNVQKITDERSNVSNHVRQKGSIIRSATENTAKWKLKDTNARMKERISEVDQMYRHLEFTLTDIKDQIQRLSDAKVAVEGCLADLLPLQEVAKEVILLRDRRREIDLVEDEAYSNIKKELRMIDKASDEFRRLAHEGFMKLAELKNRRDSLVIDLSNKNHALEIDKYKLSLTPECAEKISYKLNPTMLPENTVDKDTWLRNCQQLQKDAEASIIKAMQLTNDIWGIIKTRRDDIKKQREATQRALRKRHHETIQARDKLGAQRKDLMDEIDRVEQEMKELEGAISQNVKNIKLSETRLENRKWRRGSELCQDEPYNATKDELLHNRKSGAILEQQLRDTRNTLNCSRHQLHRVEDDLERKERSLAIESTSLNFHGNPPKAPYQMDIAWRAPTTSLTFSALAGLVQEGIEDASSSPKEGFQENPIATADSSTMTDPTPGVEYVLEN